MPYPVISAQLRRRWPAGHDGGELSAANRFPFPKPKWTRGGLRNRGSTADEQIEWHGLLPERSINSAIIRTWNEPAIGVFLITEISARSSALDWFTSGLPFHW